MLGVSIRSGAALALIFATGILGACGDGGSSSPGPAATASSTPTPTVTPSPSTNTANSPGPLPAGSYPRENLVGHAVCADGSGTFQSRSDPSPGLAAFSLTSAPSLTFFEIGVVGQDEYFTEPSWAYDGPRYWFSPAFKVASNVQGFDSFLFFNTEGGIQLTIARLAAQEAIWATYGTRSSAKDLCVYAVSLARALPPLEATTLAFAGNVDGFIADPAVTHRLYDSRATLAVDKTRWGGTLKLEIRATDQPFGDYRSRTSQPVARFEALLTGQPEKLSGPLRSDDGAWTGRIEGTVGPPRDRAAVFAFSVTHTDGREMFGVAALGDPTCPGCWDY